MPVVSLDWTPAHATPLLVGHHGILSIRQPTTPGAVQTPSRVAEFGHIFDQGGAAARHRGAPATGLRRPPGPGAPVRSLPDDQTAHSATASAGHLPRLRLSGSWPPRLGRPCGPSHAIGSAAPRHGVHSPGSRRLRGGWRQTRTAPEGQLRIELVTYACLQGFAEPVADSDHLGSARRWPAAARDEAGGRRRRGRCRLREGSLSREAGRAAGGSYAVVILPSHSPPAGTDAC